MPRSAPLCSSLLPNVSKCEMSRRAEVGPTAPLLSIRRYQLPLLGGAQLSSQLSCSAFSPSGETKSRAGQARLRARPAQPGAPGWCGARPGRQCVMVMLTCPTFVIHLCDNWDRCFHVHPQCVSNQGRRLVNTVQDKRRATSPDRTTSSVVHHSSLQLQPQPSVVVEVV